MKKLPKFKSAQEEREFWETHEALDYFDVESFVPLAPLMKRIKLDPVYVAPDGTEYELLKRSSKRLALAHNPHTSGSRNRKKARGRKEPFLIG